MQQQSNLYKQPNMRYTAQQHSRGSKSRNNSHRAYIEATTRARLVFLSEPRSYQQSISATIYLRLSAPTHSTVDVGEAVER